MKTLSEHLADRGLDYLKAAAVIGAKPSVVWRHIKGERGISSAYVRLYHEHFGIPLADLIQVPAQPGPAPTNQ